MFYIYVVHEKKNYKVMIEGGSCVNIIAKTTIKKMGLKAEPHIQPYNVGLIKWLKLLPSVVTCLSHMFCYQDRVSCDILDMDVAHILLDRPWLT